MAVAFSIFQSSIYRLLATDPCRRLIKKIGMGSGKFSPLKTPVASLPTGISNINAADGWEQAQ